MSKGFDPIAEDPPPNSSIRPRWLRSRPEATASGKTAQLYLASGAGPHRTCRVRLSRSVRLTSGFLATLAGSPHKPGIPLSTSKDSSSVDLYSSRRVPCSGDALVHHWACIMAPGVAENVERTGGSCGSESPESQVSPTSFGCDSLIDRRMPSRHHDPSSDPSERPTTARSTFGNGRRCGPAP